MFWDLKNVLNRNCTSTEKQTETARAMSLALLIKRKA